MLIPGIRIAGKLLNWHSGIGLILVDSGVHYILRFGLIVRDLESVVLPEELLDDWGHEVGYPALFEWISEHAFRFPRAEVFGYDLNGERVQFFLREFEHNAKLPCYAYDSERQSPAEGQLLDSILIPDVNTSEGARVEPPRDINLPLRVARVKWWKVPAETGRSNPKKSRRENNLT